MVRLLIIYDISSKSNIMKQLKRIGTHVQNSAFEIEINDSDIDKFSQGLAQLIDESIDNVIIYNLGNTDRVKKIILGVNKLNILDTGYIII